MAANSTVAVVYSGHLGVVVPEAGALARRYLVDPLRASVFVAGQHGSSVETRPAGRSLRHLGFDRLSYCWRSASSSCLCRNQGGSAFGQLALRRLLSAPHHALGSGQPRPICRASSHHRHEAGEAVDSRTVWGQAACAETYAVPQSCQSGAAAVSYAAAEAQGS